MPSPFLTPGVESRLDSLALLHLRRDQTIPTILRAHDDENLGYDEGKVVNTRFGSFPHSTLYNQPWGSQIVASKVDTGSRGRRPPPPPPSQQQQLKRKADDLESTSTPGDEDPKQPSQKQKTAVAASSGFLHILSPTPELWTASLPHRTQVVYTPDYSYILHRLCVRPGSTVIEAGAGSGSFTHAAARAAFNGYPTSADDTTGNNKRLGKVCSFEFHAQRAQKIHDELHDHGLDGLVNVTHRDVYSDGFLLGDTQSGPSPKANAIFLDLPAPWLALKHLVRHPESGTESPLDPSSPVYICTFSPCIEQAQRTISTMRQLSWLQISMVEVNHRKIEVKRERTGLEYEGARGAVVWPKSVDEAVAKMRAVEERSRVFRERMETQDENANTSTTQQPLDNKVDLPEGPSYVPVSSDLPSYKQGRLVHRTESDLKTHTSYLVFAVLPREWTDEDERRCREKWPSQQVREETKPKGKKQMKREEKERLKQEGK